MSGMTPDPADGANPFGELAKFALAATERNIALARSWSDALLATLKEQSEGAQANLTTLAASLEAMERVLASQEETNRALRQSLEGYREIIDRYAAAQERTAQLVQSAVDDLKAAGEGQMEAARALLTPPTWATGDGGHRAVHADDKGVDRCLHSLQPRAISRSPIILMSAMAKVLTLVQLGVTAFGRHRVRRLVPSGELVVEVDPADHTQR